MLSPASKPLRSGSQGRGLLRPAVSPVLGRRHVIGDGAGPGAPPRVEEPAMLSIPDHHTSGCRRTEGILPVNHQPVIRTRPRNSPRIPRPVPALRENRIRT
ncbi:hypothetical protein GCM10027294_24750 [Marinactinospora endophytica]